MAVRREEELKARLRDAIEARKSLLAEEMQLEDAGDHNAIHDLQIEIANLSGVITTLQWVLQTSTEAEDEAWSEDADDGDDMIEIAEFSEGDMPPAIDAETRPAR